MPKLTYFFLKYGGHIKYKIPSGKKFSKDLEGGLEIPFQIDNQQYKQKNDRCHERKTEPHR